MDLFKAMDPLVMHRRSSEGARQKSRQGKQQQFYQLTLEFEEALRSFIYFYTGRDKDLIISQNLNNHNFWMFFDAVYFPASIAWETERVRAFRKKSSLNKNGSYPPTKDPLELSLFISQLRTRVAKVKNTLNLSEILQTSTEQLIEIQEAYLQKHKLKMETMMARLQQEEHEQQKKDQEELVKLGIVPVRSPRLFRYEQFKRSTLDHLIKMTELRAREPKCQLCFTGEKIIKCQTCDLFVHAQCYPPLLKSQASKDFICDQCTRMIPKDKMQCELCPCNGGYFLPLPTADYKNPSFNITWAGQGLKYTFIQQHRAKSHIHLSCFALHSECQYNFQEQYVQGLHLIDRRRPRNVCSICGTTIGVTINCATKNCRRFFHAECARVTKLNINVIKGNNTTLLEVYCDNHKFLEPCEVFKQSMISKLNHFKRLYEGISDKLKRLGISTLQLKHIKGVNIDEQPKKDVCLVCGQENDYQQKLRNCSKCSDWYHLNCIEKCPACNYS